jgi:hypothetical protein
MFGQQTGRQNILHSNDSKHSLILNLCQRIIPGPRQIYLFLNKANFLQKDVLSTSPNPQGGAPHLVGCPLFLIQYIPSYAPYWTPFLLPQAEDAPYRGDRDTLVTVLTNSIKKNLTTVGVCYNERWCYNELMPQRTVFINKIRMLQRTVFSIKSGCCNEHRCYNEQFLSIKSGCCNE